MKVIYFSYLMFILVLFQSAIFSKSEEVHKANLKEHVITSKNVGIERVQEDPSRIDVPAAINGDYQRDKYRVMNRKANQEYYDNKDESLKRCAVMYKDNEPVGILQPYEESFKLLPVKEDKLLVDMSPTIHQRDTADAAEFTEDYNDRVERDDTQSYFTDNKYPSVLTNFKIESRLQRANLLETNPEKPQFKKRQSENKRNSKRHISEEQLGSLKSTLSKLHSSKSNNNQIIEDELKGILDDMGLIDDDSSDKDDEHQKKREVSSEDEDLEEGPNKISLEKEEQIIETKEKKREGPAHISQISETLSNQFKGSTTEDSSLDMDNKLKRELRNAKKGSLKEEKIPRAKKAASNSTNDAAIHAKNSPSTQKLRNKREKTSDKLVRDLEKSGELTVSGNKSPLAYSSTLEQIEEPKDSSASEYDKRVERHIQKKIESLKDEVKRELESMKSSDTTEEGVKCENDESQRKKREITLVDEENENIDPVANTDETLQPHIRRRRHISYKDYDFTTPQNFNPSKRVAKISGTSTTTPKSNAVFGLLNKIIDPINIHDIFVHKRQMNKSTSENTTTTNFTLKTLTRRKRNVNDDEEDENMRDDPEFMSNKKEAEKMKRNYQTFDSRKGKRENCDCEHGSCKCGSSSKQSKSFNEDDVLVKRKLNSEVNNNNDDNNLERRYIPIAGKRENCNCQHGECRCGQDNGEILRETNSLTDDDYDQEENIQKRSDNAYKNEPIIKGVIRQKRGGLFNLETLRFLPVEIYGEPQERYDYRKKRHTHFNDKRNGRSEYLIDLQPDVYQISPYHYARRKRDNSYQNPEAVQAESSAVSHILAVKSRSAHPRIRRKVVTARNNQEAQQLTDLSDEDIFGALPQGFEGELSRYKRVKRTDKEKASPYKEKR